MLSAGGITGATVNYNIEPNFTFTSQIIAGRPVIVLPGYKIQRVEDMPPTTYTEAGLDILSLNQLQAVWTIYGAAVADTDQVIRFNLQ